MMENEYFNSYDGIRLLLESRNAEALKQGWTPARMMCDLKTFEIFTRGLWVAFKPNEEYPKNLLFADLTFPLTGEIRLYPVSSASRFIEAKRALTEIRDVIESCPHCGNPTFYLMHTENESYPNGTKYLPQTEISNHYLVCTKCLEKQEIV